MMTTDRAASRRRTACLRSTHHSPVESGRAGARSAVIPDSGDPALNIASLGWGETHADTFQEHADAALRPGRVAIQHRGAYVLLTEEGEVWASVRGRLRHAAGDGDGVPAVGDW